ncbi:MAG: hypothetical protein EXS08_01975 [Planctomycetes bacterium]|nr:hypothetical protein [Planctomycetota bacterium]
MLFLLASCALLVGPWLAQTAPEHAPEPAAALAEPSQAVPAAAEPAPPPRNLDTLFDGALVGAKDAEDFAETPSYRRLLEMLSNYSDEELARQATRTLDVPAALAQPEAWRGEIVRVRALVAHLQTVRLANPLADHVDTYRAFLVNDLGLDKESEGMVVDFLEEPPELELRRDVVDVEAVFFRVLRYENAKGVLKDLPYLIARAVRRFDQTAAPRSTTLSSVAKIFVGAAVAFIVARILLSLRSSKNAERSPASSRALRERALALASKRPPSSAKKT